MQLSTRARPGRCIARVMPIMTLRDWSQRIRSADLRASSCLLAGRLRRTRMVDLGGFPAGDVRLRAWPEGSLCLREGDRIPIRLGWAPARSSCSRPRGAGVEPCLLDTEPELAAG